MEYTYEAIDENGEDLNPKKMESKAREGKTELQKLALSATSSAKIPKFTTTDLHKRFRKLEEKAIKGTEESIVFKAWMQYCINGARSMNSKKPTIPLKNLISWMENEDKWQEWKMKNWDRVILENKKSVKGALKKAEIKFQNRS